MNRTELVKKVLSEDLPKIKFSVIELDERALLDMLGGGECCISRKNLSLKIRVKKSNKRNNVIKAMKILVEELRIPLVKLSNI